MRSTTSQTALKVRPIALRRLAAMLRPQHELTPDAWGAANRVYGPSAGRPGPRDPAFTPYAVPFGRAVASRRFRRCVAVFGAQSGKSESLLDIIGARMAQRPAPILYVGPSRQFLTEQFAPRVEALLDEAPTLADRVQRGKRSTMTRKVINGVPLRLAHAGSSTALKSDPAALAIVDEADELVANVKGQGNPIGLVDARGDTVADFVMAVVSTPSAGPIETEIAPVSGLEFWRPVDPKLVQSTIWRMFQAGTMGHWAVPCPECSRYFIPRFSIVEWPETVPDVVDGAPVERKLTPAEVRREAFIRCPNKGCRAEIRDDPEGDNLKAEMNRRGVYVCPGQSVTPEGDVVGPMPENSTASFWASGLMSPFRTVGDRAAAYVEAARSGDQQSLQTVVNAGLGELFAPRGGEAPEWAEVKAKALPYRSGLLPDGAVRLSCGVDVQKGRLVYVVRGWGARGESWLIEAGEKWGETSANDVWQDLQEQVLAIEWHGAAEFVPLKIERCFIDSGFRPGRPDLVPEHKIYTFCRTFMGQCLPVKGFATRQTPFSMSKNDVLINGQPNRNGLKLGLLDSDYFKSWVHQKIKEPSDVPGAWHVPFDVSEQYCRQVVSESRARRVSGGFTWTRNSRENHFLDCEAMARAAAYTMGVDRIRDGARRKSRVAVQAEENETYAGFGASRRAPAPPPGNVEDRDAKADIGDVFRALRGR